MESVLTTHQLSEELDQQRGSRHQQPGCLRARAWIAALRTGLKAAQLSTFLRPSCMGNACKDGLFPGAGGANLTSSTQGGATDG